MKCQCVLSFFINFSNSSSTIKVGKESTSCYLKEELFTKLCMCVYIFIYIHTKEHLILFQVFISSFRSKISLPENLEFLVNLIFSYATYDMLRGNGKQTIGSFSTSNPSKHN